MKSTIYADKVVKNKQSKTASRSQYYPCLIVAGSLVHTALFTRNQLDTAIERAGKNPEDVPAEQPFWIKLWSRWLS
jgi:hypothetical protein